MLFQLPASSYHKLHKWQECISSIQPHTRGAKTPVSKAACSPDRRRLIHLSTTARRLHHRIHLNTDARADVAWWDRFLPSWNGVAMCIAPDWRVADSINLYTDASGSLGFGAYFNGAWIRGHWQPPNNHQLAPYSGMYLAAALTWGYLLSGQHIRFHCDNLPIVQAWASQSSKHSGIMCIC